MKKILTYLSGTILLFNLVSCTPSSTPSSATKPTNKETQQVTNICNNEEVKYFKYMQGKKYTYTMKMEGIPNIPGVPNLGNISMPNLTGDFSIEILEVNDNKYKMKIVSNMPPSPEQVFVEEGNICEVPNVSKDVKKEELNITTLGEEKVTVPAGTFDCVKQEMSDKKTGLKQTLWVSKEIGMFVKMIIQGPMNMVYELKDYTK